MTRKQATAPGQTSLPELQPTVETVPVEQSHIYLELPLAGAAGKLAFKFYGSDALQDLNRALSELLQTDQEGLFPSAADLLEQVSARFAPVPPGPIASQPAPQPAAKLAVVGQPAPSLSQPAQQPVQAQPTPAQVIGQPTQPDPQQSGWCAVHGTQMRWRQNADGGWYSHKVGDQWCKGK